MADSFWSSETIISADGTESVVSKTPRKNSPLEEVAAVLTLLTWFGSVWLIPWLLLWLLFAAVVWASKSALTTVLILIALSFLPAGNIWWAYRSLPVWDLWRRRFSMRLVTPPKDHFLLPDKNYLFAEFPHTVYPMGSWLGLPLCGKQGTGLPYNLRGGIASIMFQLPVVKHNYAWAGCMPAEYKRMLAHLREPGAALSVIPEGIAGIFLAQDTRVETIFLSKRKGFVRLAIQAGADLVPVYHLGQSQLLTFWGPEKLSRRWRASIGIFWGAWGLPLPRKHPIISLVGAPIPVKQEDHPSQEQIDKVHGQFAAEIKKLFDDHKHLLGPHWAQKELQIV
ncbi:Diacylglycerol O-acyltransferase 2 [Coccomyxa sp. Obi]|uniref:Acyltransferase n=1 Tax=Pseudochoricystis ellipsoidea (nom. nud.) TaxID=546385 RepID=A0A2Z5UHH8_9CHLO|nr:type-e diacylglycerol acyltransferase [Pseudochoricystis ellipsoidea (nom. nud.)]BDA49182.1 Diacylglycerol O-acyltransferase 2 [Coccomyxa sp. Obi]